MGGGRRALALALTALACGCHDRRVGAAADRSLLAASDTTRWPAGGGLVSGGLVGSYFASADLSGPPAFVRKDVRVDFDWGEAGAPGGSRSPGFASLGDGPFSVRWTGQLIARFGEPYRFYIDATGQARLRLRPAGSAQWTTLVDQPAATSVWANAQALEAGRAYDVELEVRHRERPARVRLLWSSPSTPAEVIDAAVQVGVNVFDAGATWLDLVRGGRGSWEPLQQGSPAPPLDENGWPLGDGSFLFQESLNQGLDVDPLMTGTVAFSFHGKAKLSLRGNVVESSLRASYDADAGETTGSFTVAPRGWNASAFSFSNAFRPEGLPGISSLRLMRPVGPGASDAVSPGTSALYTPQLKDALAHYTLLRFQLVANQERDWSDRTRPGWFNQAQGKITAPHQGVGEARENGRSWEEKVMLANETGRDLLLSIPVLATGRTPQDTGSYLYKLACLLRYGSDGVEPYLHEVQRPAWPPLNPNLRVYLELGNELWNFGGVFNVDFSNLTQLTSADAAAANQDFAALNYDGLTTAKDPADGHYLSVWQWRPRKVMLRLRQLADIFAAVFGPGEPNRRVRVVYEFQYDNANDTAGSALEFAERWFDNADGEHVPAPLPVSAWLWGGGGATYYGAANPDGATGLLPGDFEAPAIAAGLQQAPPLGPWSFSGTAGLARPDATGEIPPPLQGQQAAYVADKGALSIRFTVPAAAAATPLAIILRAVNRVRAGKADGETLRILVDGDDLTARTFSQGDGIRPPGYDPGNPWQAQNVFWTWSRYYASRTFLAAPGSSHTLTIQGAGDVKDRARPDQLAFVDDVHLASADALFGSAIPAGGDAAGQSPGQEYRRVLQVEADWARAFGLQVLAYEGGWSIGGDDGGSPLQLVAKYRDPRTRAAQRTSLDWFHRAGGALSVLGTYAQWPSWSDFVAEQGLLDAGRYPLVQGADDAQLALPAAPPPLGLPATLLPSAAAIARDGYGGLRDELRQRGSWMAWNVVVPAAGRYRVAAALEGAGAAALLIDGRAALAPGAGARGPWATVPLTAGQHSIGLRSTGPARLRVLRVELAAAP